MIENKNTNPSFLQRYTYEKECSDKCKHTKINRQCLVSVANPLTPPLRLRDYIVSFLDLPDKLTWRVLCKDFYATTPINIKKNINRKNIELYNQKDEKSGNNFHFWSSFPPLFKDMIIEKFCLKGVEPFKIFWPIFKKTLNSRYESKQPIITLNFIRGQKDFSEEENFLWIFNQLKDNRETLPCIKKIIYDNYDEEQESYADPLSSGEIFNLLQSIKEYLPQFPDLATLIFQSDLGYIYFKYKPKSNSLILPSFNVEDAQIKTQLAHIQSLHIYPDETEMSDATCPFKMINQFFPSLTTLKLEWATELIKAHTNISLENYKKALESHKNIVNVQTILLLYPDVQSEGLLLKNQKICQFLAKFTNVSKIIVKYSNKNFTERNRSSEELEILGHSFLNLISEHKKEGLFEKLSTIVFQYFDLTSKKMKKFEIRVLNNQQKRKYDDSDANDDSLSKDKIIKN